MDSKSKKTKLTLTVRKNIIEKARQRAQEAVSSISQLFEEVFKEEDSNRLKQRSNGL